MLQSMKERITGPVAWVIVLLLVVPFAFFGIEQFRSGGGDPTVAKVNGEKITQSQFQRAYQQQYQRLAQMLGENFRADMINTAGFRQRVLDDMIQERVLSDYADGQGYRVSDSDLIEYLRKQPAFQQDGSFSYDAYKAVLARNGQTPAGFQAVLRNAMAIEQLRDGVLDSGFSTPVEFAVGYQIQNQKRALRYVRFPVAAYLDQVEVSEEQIQARYDEQSERYQAPERIQLAYIELDRDALPPTDKPDSEVLRLIYDAEKDIRFSDPEQRLVRHILVEFGADRDAAKAKADALKTQLDGGADFADLATAESDDPSSRDDGGSLGWVRRGQYDEAFEDAVFSSPEAQAVGPVESAFGWHLIRVDSIKDAQLRAFEDDAVQAQLLDLFNAREAAQRFEDYAEQIDDLAFQHEDSLQPVAEAIGLEVRTTDWLTRASQSGLMAFDAVRNAAFSDEVLRGENSELLTVSPTKVLVLRQQAYEAARVRPLEEVSDEIRDELRHEAARERVATLSAEALASVRGDVTLDAIASEHKAELETPGQVTRAQADVPRPILGALFRMPRPTDARPSFETVQLGNGDSALIALDAVSEPSPEAETAEARQTAQARLRDANSGAEFSAALESIRRAANIEMMATPDEAALFE